MSSHKYKLIYFHLKGRGEVTRTLFHLAGQPFDEVRIPLEQWSETMKTTFPFHQLPLLEVTSKATTHRIAQSHAIERFLAARFGLFGKDDVERARIDMLGEQIVDIFTPILFIFRKSESAEKRLELDEAMRERVPNGLKLIQNQLEANRSEYLVGSNISLVDVQLINFYDWLRERKLEILDKLPLLRKHDLFIRSLPKMQEQLKKSAGVRLARVFPD